VNDKTLYHFETHPIICGFGGMQYTSVCNPSMNTKCSRSTENALRYVWIPDS